MADAYTRFIRSAPGGMLAKQLGLPRPSRLLRRDDRPEPVLGPVVVLGASYRGRVKETAFSGVFPTVDGLRSRGAEVLVHDPMFTDDELARYGFTAYHLGDPVDAAILQADHPEYLALTPADLPGVRAFVDGRGVIDAANWPGVTFLRLGDGEA